MISRLGVGVFVAFFASCANKSFRCEVVTPNLESVHAVYLLVGKDLGYSETPSELVQPEKQKGYSFFAKYEPQDQQWTEEIKKGSQLQPEVRPDGLWIRIPKRDLDTLFAGSSLGILAQFPTSDGSVWAFEKVLLRSRDQFLFRIADRAVTIQPQ